MGMELGGGEEGQTGLVLMIPKMWGRLSQVWEQLEGRQGDPGG